MTTYTALISTAALAAEARPDWVIADCRFDLGNEGWGHEQYLLSHIPGAVYASLSGDLAGPRTGTNGRHPLPAVDALAATFGRLGIANTSQVVVYDQSVGLHASRLWWSLRYLGHQTVALLDGGWAKWMSEGRPVTSGEEARAAASFAPAPRPRMVTPIADVQARMGDGRVYWSMPAAPTGSRAGPNPSTGSRDTFRGRATTTTCRIRVRRARFFRPANCAPGSTRCWATTPPATW